MYIKMDSTCLIYVPSNDSSLDLDTPIVQAILYMGGYFHVVSDLILVYSTFTLNPKMSIQSYAMILLLIYIWTFNFELKRKMLLMSHYPF